MTQSMLLALSGLSFVSGPAPAPDTLMVERAAHICNDGVSVERTSWLMGTTLRAVVCAESREAAVSAIELAFAAVAETETRLSTWRADSELSRVNAAAVGTWVPVSPATAATLRKVRHWSELTDGAFDPAVGDVMISRGFRGHPADVDEADATAGLTRAPGGGPDALGWEVDDAFPRVRRLLDVRLDAGGFGKGAGIETALAALRPGSIAWIELDFGGQIARRSFGEGDPGSLVVWVAHPGRRGEPVGRLEVDASHVSTTSASERFVEDERGRRTGHVFDPRSGEAIEAWGSVTVAADDALVADVLSTALFVMGPDTALQWSEQHPDIGVLLYEVGPDEELRVRTSGMKAGMAFETTY